MGTTSPLDVEFAGQVFVDGRWVGPAGDRIDSINPATGEAVGWVVESGDEVVAEAFDAARRAQYSWNKTPVADRAAFLEAWGDSIDASGESLARLVTLEMGMPITQSRSGQVDLPARVLRSLAACGRRVDWERVDESGATVVREGSGVVLAITPWNFPVHQIVAKVGAAIMAGCTVVLKPAELASLNALHLADLAQKVGLPDGVLNVVTGSGAGTGERLLQSIDYDTVSFTGSPQVGQHIGAVAGSAVIRATLELGGKSPSLVLPHAPFEQAVRTTVANAFVNAGQKCNAPTRLLVPRQHLSRAVEIASEAADGFRIGDPQDEATTMGPLVSQSQRSRVLGFVDRAREQGGRVHGGTSLSGSGSFVHPAIVSEVTSDQEIAREEVFGPVMVVLGYEDVADGIRMANDSEYGLSAEVWAESVEGAREVADELRAGQVRINGARTPALPIAPFGGYKRSGIGRELGVMGIEEFTEAKSILV